MRLLRFSSNEFDTEGAGQDQQLSVYGEDTIRALLGALERAGHQPGEVWPDRHGWVGIVIAEDVRFEINVALVEPGTDPASVGQSAEPQDEGSAAVAPVWFAMIVPRLVDPRSLWQRLRGVPAPPLPPIATRAEALLQAAVETIADVEGLEWVDDAPVRPTTF